MVDCVESPVCYNVRYLGLSVHTRMLNTGGPLCFGPAHVDKLSREGSFPCMNAPAGSVLVPGSRMALL